MRKYRDEVMITILIVIIIGMAIYAGHSYHSAKTYEAELIKKDSALMESINDYNKLVDSLIVEIEIREMAFQKVISNKVYYSPELEARKMQYYGMFKHYRSFYRKQSRKLHTDSFLDSSFTSKHDTLNYD